MSEHEQPSQPGEPLYPSPLPPELAEFLRGQAYACVTTASDQGTVFVIKAPAHEIQTTYGPMPINLRHELYEHPAGPVIRIVITIHDRPGAPLALETFINMADPEQRADFEVLAAQDRILLLFYDEALTHRLSKVVGNRATLELKGIGDRALAYLATIDSNELNFDHAKAEVMRWTHF